jgi:hypothetical protein
VLAEDVLEVEVTRVCIRPVPLGWANESWRIAVVRSDAGGAPREGIISGWDYPREECERQDFMPLVPGWSTAERVLEGACRFAYIM